MSTNVPPPPTGPPAAPPPVGPSTPPPPPSGGYDPGGGGLPPGGAASRVSGPAIGLIVTAAIGALMSIFGLLSQLVFGGASWGMQDMGADYEWLARYTSGAFGLVSAVIGIAIAVFIIWAALQMRELRNWGLAVAASIVAMIPCISPCCVLGIPIGIWALVVLTKPEIKASFH